MNDENRSQKASKATGHTAVVYFHGMGEQRRYEEVSRLVGALDRFAYRSKNEWDSPLGSLTRIKARLEPPRSDDDSDMGYINVVHRFRPEGEEEQFNSYRFYEVYWASVAAGGSSPFTVLRWLLSKTITPLITITNAWRHRQRLRRYMLHSIWARERNKNSDKYSDKDLLKLLHCYDEFEGPSARRRFPSGTFKDFLVYIENRWAKRPETLKRIINLAQAWRRHYLNKEVQNILVVFTILLSMGLVIGSIIGLCAITLNLVTQSGFVSSLSELIPFFPENYLSVSLQNISAMVAVLLSLIGISPFLRTHVGDVQMWTTYQETKANNEKRAEILRRGTTVLEQVLKDNNCSRIVVVAHSLGTAIAMDSLLQVGRYNRARNRQAPMNDPLPLEKLDHFITLGSPIDKVHYFFESYRSKFHRYNRVVEEVRGDIGEVPFTKNRHPHIHWINYWDRGDIISGSLETPSNRRIADVRVDNVQISNLLFPAPIACHSGYFENRRVIGDIFRMIFFSDWSFENAVLVPDVGKDYESLMIGPGKPSRSASVYQVLVLTVPWFLVASTLCWGFSRWLILNAVTYSFTALVIIVPLTGWVVSKFKGHTDKL